MEKFYVNKEAQSGGEHEVHRSSCKHLPHSSNLEYLGYFSNCQDAVKEAKKHYTNVDGCWHCCRNCHTR